MKDATESPIRLFPSRNEFTQFANLPGRRVARGTALTALTRAGVVCLSRGSTEEHRAARVAVERAYFRAAPSISDKKRVAEGVLAMGL